MVGVFLEYCCWLVLYAYLCLLGCLGWYCGFAWRFGLLFDIGYLIVLVTCFVYCYVLLFVAYSLACFYL